MLSQQQVESFQHNGFVAGSVVLTDERVEELRVELDRVIADQDRTDVAQPVLCRNLAGVEEFPVWQVVNIWEASPAFRDHLSEPRIVEEVAQLTGAQRLRVWHDQIQYKPPFHGGVTGWHQDAPAWPSIEPATQVTAWVALDEVDETNGCMRMVPGSQEWGDQTGFLRASGGSLDLPPTFDGHELDVSFRPVQRGAVHYHHCLTWHASHANSSDRPRRAIAVHYMTGDTRFVANGGHVMQQFVTVRDGDVLQGDHFPVVYDGSSVASPAV